jgi:hypothetical protein
MDLEMFYGVHGGEEGGEACDLSSARFGSVMEKSERWVMQAAVRS